MSVTVRTAGWAGMRALAVNGTNRRTGAVRVPLRSALLFASSLGCVQFRIFQRSLSAQEIVHC